MKTKDDIFEKILQLKNMEKIKNKDEKYNRKLFQNINNYYDSIYINYIIYNHK